MGSKLLLMTLLFGSSAHALSAQEIKSIDTYVIQRSGATNQCASMIAGVDETAKKYIAEAERAIHDDLPMIAENERLAATQLELWGQSMRLALSTNWDVYQDPLWMQNMRREVRNFCCNRPPPGANRQGLVYQRFRNSAQGQQAPPPPPRRRKK